MFYLLILTLILTLCPNGQNAAVTTTKSPNVTTGKPSTSPPVKRRLCKNEYNDIGFCVNSLECEVTRGINIGVCSKSGQSSNSNVCCLHLPCSLPLISNSDQELFMNLGLRTTRDLRNALGNNIDDEDIELVTPDLVAPGLNCGLRETSGGISGQSLPFMRDHHSGRNEQIINGYAVSSDKKNPYMLALWIQFKQTNVPTCGAGLISTRYAITAGHCVSDTKLTYVLRGGSIINKIVFAPADSHSGAKKLIHPGDENGGGVVMEIASITIHPKYQPFTFENDIALIRLKENVQTSRELFPICLPPPIPASGKVTDYSGELVTVTGWGCEEENCNVNDIPIVLREAQIPIVPNDVGMCWFMNDSFKGSGSEYIPSRVFMVGGDESGSKATCNGDSGSPVVRKRRSSSDGVPRWEVIGLVSWSKGCGRPFRPSVWTRVENYVDWITSNMHD